MEAVKAFNSELYSLNEYKPPISKAKMTQITKAAIKAIKFYKHVVQSVEKFIQKCKPEYKVPGLYVIDSIVRQSRHQFGQEKDVFAPRFSKNIINTFQNLYRCPSDDKSKIVRVLNLWQKNSVFKSDIIQPLLDMAAGILPPSITSAHASTTATVSNNTPGTPVTPATPANIVQGIPDSWTSQLSNTDTIAAVAQLLQSPQGQQMQQQKPQPSLLQALDAGLVVQLQALTAQLTAAAAAANTLNPLEQRVSFNKKLLEQFDFGEDSEHVDESKKDISSNQLPVVAESINSSIFHQLAEHLQQQNLEQFQKQLMEQQDQQPQKTSLETQEGMFGSENSATPSQDDSQTQLQDPDNKLDDSLDIQQQEAVVACGTANTVYGKVEGWLQDMEIDEAQDIVDEDIFEPEEKKVIESRSRTRSKSRSSLPGKENDCWFQGFDMTEVHKDSQVTSIFRSPRKRRSRSRSGSRKRKHRKRSRSRSRERKRKSSRSYSSERRAREREKERQKKGLPPIRSKTLSVCSTTLWVGQVDKKATQQDLTNLFEEFGQIESINMIPPRGCAYICMVHRQDAFRARQKLSTGNYKIGSKIIKIAWALNKGVKQEYKQFWDVDLGVTYIPWEKVKVDDLDGFAEGGIIDQETVNNEWEAVKSCEPAKENTSQTVTTETTTLTTTQAEIFTQPVTMLPVQIPVAQGVPSVSLVPPAFPVTMTLPPPGYGHPPPPFLRPGFNTSQPPPGFMPPPVVPQTSIAHVPSLGQPPVSTSQETVKDSSYGGFMPPTSTIPGSFSSAGMSGIYNPVSAQSQQSSISESDDKELHISENRTTSTDNKTGLGVHCDTRPSSVSLLGMPPAVSLSQNIHHSSIPAPRIHGLLPLDIRPGMMPPPGGPRFPLMMQPGMPPPPPGMPPPTGIPPQVGLPPQVGMLPQAGMPPHTGVPPQVGMPPQIGLPPQTGMPHQHGIPHHSGLHLQPGMPPPARMPPHPGLPHPPHLPPPGVLDPMSARHRGPFPPVDHFSRPEGHFGRPNNPSGNSVSKPNDSAGNDSIQQEGDKDYRFPPVEKRDGLLRPPIENRDSVVRPHSVMDGRDGQRGLAGDGSRREPLSGFRSESRWGPPRGDFDEREHRGISFTGPKSYSDERTGSGNFRFDERVGPTWSRGFETDIHQDFDDRRPSWERQRDRDDRDFDFRKEMNGNRFGCEQEHEPWSASAPHSQAFKYYEGESNNQKKDESSQVNGDKTDNETQPEQDKMHPELSKQQVSPKESGNEKNEPKDSVEKQPVVEKTETEGT
ncbi:SR-related and CTD-associated factor 8 isoform X24 [Erpetoichthys calabaricus]|uniref:SR-related and CTD-associated factor 8 isoform X22 n=1 Tax=Erpetoichthys calabaricus TaxID=27687 RepID=UPI002234962A|nr:SR-related and CTD-associated factor 8 isoform X22 [Erpetoichthys calabaricus]XP_051781144.1 SR-related and CTD-associated factor 8 isoform X23 [Erpetoichthys calabaricus]XP_051781145.1 SR-related and CTD-associated factor 8 isoform X24 [Erpetoichthys calabaricus]